MNKQQLKIGHYVFINTEIIEEASGLKMVYVSVVYTKTNFELRFRYKGDVVNDYKFWFLLGTEIEDKKNEFLKKGKSIDCINKIYLAIQNYLRF